MNNLSSTHAVSATSLNPPAPPSSAPTYTVITATNVTLTNVPALSTGSTILTVTSAGTAPDNGSYVPNGATYNGLPVFQNANGRVIYMYGLAGNTYFWGMGQAVADNGGDYFASSGSGTPPMGTWTTNTGTVPPAVLTASRFDAATSSGIQRALDSGFTSGLTTFMNVTPSTNFLDTTLSAGTTYYYRYVEVNAGGSAAGPFSSVTTALAAAAVKYLAEDPYTPSATAYPASSFILNAPYLTDGIPGDNTTDYEATRKVFALYDMGQIVTLAQIYVTTTIVNFAFYVSDDGVNWSSVIFLPRNSIQSLDASHASGRYFQVYCAGPRSAAAQIFDYRLYDKYGQVVLAPPPSPITALWVRSTSGYVSESGVNNNNPNLADAPQQYDQFTTIGGNSNTLGIISIIWDLGSPIAIASAQCWTAYGVAFQISWSNDGTTWTTDAARYTGDGGAVAINQTARYIRFCNAVGGSVTVFETRLVDANGLVVLGPAVPRSIKGVYSISGIQSITF